MRYFLFLMLLSSTVFADSSYRVNRPDPRTMDKIATEFEVLRKLPDGFEVFVQEAKLKRFLELAPTAEMMGTEKSNMMVTTGYRTFATLEDELKQIAQKYPTLAKLETYGKTSSGHTLYVLKISDNVATDEDEPELMLTSATHGDEIITVEVEMALVHELLENYNKDPRLTKMVNEKELFFIPVVNPQGYSKQTRYAGMVDPNRDYPYPGHEEKKSVDCIDAEIKFFNGRNIKGSIDLHAYGKLIMFPWAYTKDAPPTADERDFSYLTNSMAEMNHYEAGQISKIIYVAPGSSADYYYWKKKTFALGIELSTSKAPPFGSVAKVIDESREMIWRFIEHF